MLRICLAVLSICCGAAAQELVLSIAGPARVRVRDAAGVDHVPAGAVVVPIGPDRWFAADGQVRLPLEGKVLVRVERGPEWVPVLETVDAPGRREIRLRRWIDMRARGYSSGESHLHVAARDLPAMMAAEDLDFGNSLYWWNGPKLPRPDGDEPVRTARFGGRQVTMSVFDTEVENAWGAVYMIGLSRPTEIPWDRARANLAYIKEARELGALVSYQGGWSREVLVDALLGLVDVVNLCNNNFHRHKYQPRSQFSNLLGVTGLPVYPNTPEGMMGMNTDTYYRLLNCGLTLAAGAESATGAKSTPAGYNRAYVKLGTKPDYRAFLDGWRRGRNFVTNGPMVFLTVNGKYEPGDTIALPPGGGKLKVRVKAESNEPLRSVEVVVNGKAVGNPEALEIREGAWIAARATAEDRLLSDEELNRYLNTKGRTEAPCRLRFAHTSPIYVTVGGKGARVEESVREARAMLEAFERFARATSSERHRAEILEAVQEARRRLGS